jgi:hypothetical protein
MVGHVEEDGDEDNRHSLAVWPSAQARDRRQL